MKKKPKQLIPSENSSVIGPIKEVVELGILSERTKKNLNFQNCYVLVWDHEPDKVSTAIDMNYFDEGTKCCKVVCGTCEWSGWGITPKDLGLIAEEGADMSKFKGGKLHFYVKGNTPSVAVSIGWYPEEKTGSN